MTPLRRRVRSLLGADAEDEADEPEDVTVYRLPRVTGTQPRLHLDRDCHYLQMSDNEPVAKNLDSFPDWYNHCGSCFPDE